MLQAFFAGGSWQAETTAKLTDLSDSDTVLNMFIVCRHVICHVLDTYIRPEVVSQPLLLNQNTRTAYVTSAYKIVLVS